MHHEVGSLSCLRCVQTFTDIVRYRFVLENLVAKNLKTLYRNMALGFFWSLLNPLVMAVVLTAVQVLMFGQKASIAVFLLVALIPYNFFAYCLSGCAGVVINNASLVTKVKFPRQVLPVSVIVTNLVHFAIQSLLVLAAIVLFPPDASLLGWQLAWLPFVLVVHVGLAVGLGLLVAGANVVYRDVQYIVDSAMTVMFWLCPLIYDPRRIDPSTGQDTWAGAPEWAFWVYYANPLAAVIDSYRHVLYYGKPPDLAVLGLATLVTLSIGAVGVRSFWKHEPRFADLI